MNNKELNEQIFKALEDLKNNKEVTDAIQAYTRIRMGLPEQPNKSMHQRRVDAFMFRAKQTLPDKPTVPSDEVVVLRAKLLLEELFETLDGMGVKVKIDGKTINYSDLKIKRNTDKPVNLVKTADGFADISVVLYGAASAFGIDMEPLLEEVDNNNLAKFAPGHYWREDGKLIKPKDHKPPDILKVLKEQGYNPDEKTEAKAS